MKFKKLITFPLIIILSAFLLQACCKAYCGLQPLNVRYINYKNTDVDTVLFIKYIANGRFDQKVDSFYNYNLLPQADTMFAVATENADYNKDWKIKILSNNKEYNVTAIKTNNKKCTCGNSTYNVISGYSLNGLTYFSDIIDLKK